MVAYGIAIFSGAFLLFQVQPLMGKYILPWFGGAPSVWTACLLFFQVALLGGYAYAHLSCQRLRPRAQVVTHLALLVLAIATLPITPNGQWQPHTTSNPTLQIILLLAVSVGLPYFALSATAPLLQHWLGYTHPGVSPFRLYALSNAGSLLALLSYPTCVESWLTRQAQATCWGAGLGVYALACVWAGLKVWKTPDHDQRDRTEASLDSARPTNVQKLLWLLLPACASVLLLAITNKICQDVAVIAFLWVLPLTVYLLSFIICFDRPKWYDRRWYGPALALGLLAVCWTMTDHLPGSVPLQILIYTVGLFCCCMVCHGEVYRLKPAPTHLTSFYLMLAAGGALGGVFVAVIGPLLFADYLELHWGLVLCGILFLVIWGRELLNGKAHLGLKSAWVGSVLLLGILTLVLWRDANRFQSVLSYQARSFYGVLKVFRYEHTDPAQAQVELMHGRIAHGMQFLHPSRASWPTLYYGPASGIGLAFELLPPAPRHIGVVGLGAGTLAAYAKAGDRLRFYELNPEVEQVARTQFTFLKNSAGQSEVVLGDARLSLERESPQNFDLLVLDAFNGDAIPVHLLTREAFEVYQRHLKTNGIVAVHVSNASLDLEPVVINLAQKFGCQSVVVEQRETDVNRGLLPSTWVLLSWRSDFSSQTASRQNARPVTTARLQLPLWTDDFSGLFPILRWEDLFVPETRTAGIRAASASSLTGQGETSAAIKRYREELRQQPESAFALNNLACLLATAKEPELRNGAEAVALAERACALTEYRETVLVSTLAAAYAEAGRFEEAVTTGEKACALARQRGEAKMLERNQQLLEFYRRRQPYHQGAP